MAYKNPEDQKAAQRRHYAKYANRYRDRSKTRYQKRKEWVRQLHKYLSCQICGEDEQVCIDFHHMIPSKKEDKVSAFFRNGSSVSRIVEEIEKCAAICGNCHRKVHAGVIDGSRLNTIIVPDELKNTPFEKVRL